MILVGAMLTGLALAAPTPAAPTAPALDSAGRLPTGVTADLIAAGDKVYHATSCVACHGADGKGTVHLWHVAAVPLEEKRTVGPVDTLAKPYG